MPGLGRGPPGPLAPPGRAAGGRGAAPGRDMPVAPSVEYGLLPGRGAAGRPMPLEPPEVNGLLPGRGWPAGRGAWPGRAGASGVEAAAAAGRGAAGPRPGCPAAPLVRPERREPPVPRGRAPGSRGPARAPPRARGPVLPGWAPRVRRGPPSWRQPSWREPWRHLAAGGGCRGGKGVPELAYDGGLDCRRGRADELTEFVQLGHDDLALDPELLGELVDPDLSHISPVSVRAGSWRPGVGPSLLHGGTHRCRLIGCSWRLDSLPDRDGRAQRAAGVPDPRRKAQVCSRS